MSRYHQNQGRRPDRFIPAALLGACAYVALDYTGPLLLGGAINLFAACAWAIVALSAIAILQDGLRYWAEWCDYKCAKTPKGLRGTAAFATYKDIEHELNKTGWGIYFGAMAGRALIGQIASNMLTLGPAGSGKDVCVVLVGILTNFFSKTVVDFKGTSACILACLLRARGEIVHILNFGDLWTDILGVSACYNPLHLIADNFWRFENGIRDVTADVFELCMQLYPEPSGGDSNGNGYFRDGSRRIIGFAVQMAILIHGYAATLGHVLQILNDKELLHRYALWAAGRLEVEGKSAPQALPIHESPWIEKHDPMLTADYTQYLRGLASGIADLLDATDNRTFESFIAGAQNALAGFDQTTRASRITSKSTFRFADQKEGDAPVTVFLVADPSRMEAQSKILGVVQWCMLQEWKRHENKSRPVYLIAKEATNFKINGADSLMTWGREFGIRIHWILQSLSAFRKVYGKEALATMLSETVVKQILPGQRDPETLKLIVDLLGQQSIIAANFSGRTNVPGYALDGVGYQEHGRALLTADEIRRLDHKGILFLGQNRPVLVDLPPVAAIAPFRKQIAINPMFGKPYLLRRHLTIKQRGKPSLDP